MPDALNQTLVGKKRRFVFMHVGKTGGTTLRQCVIKMGCQVIANKARREACLKNIGPKSVLSKRTRGIVHHLHVHAKRQYTAEKATDLLFTVREPVARFESWYRFSDPKNCMLQEEMNIDGCKAKRRAHLHGRKAFSARFYYFCFPMLETMGQALDPSHVFPSAANRTDCVNLVNYAFQQVGKTELYHLTAGYRFYHRAAALDQYDKTVWVVRMEALWEDVQKIDIAVGGTGNFSAFSEKWTHGSEGFWDQS